MKHEKTPLDTFELEFMPMEMKAYLRNNGFSFSKKACEWAISQMKKENPSTKKEEKIEPWNKEKVDELLKKYNVVLENNVGYNYVYTCNMLLADKYKSSIPDEQHLALGIKDCIDDIDASPRLIFKQWITHMDDSGIPIDWESLL
jgi:hypothetical protein